MDESVNLAPLDGETASSFAWRLARSNGLTLHELSRWLLGVTSTEFRGDLDELLPGVAAGKMAELSGIAPSLIERLRPPLRLNCPTWSASIRRHAAQIYVCPDCVNDDRGHADLVWRSKLGVACPHHRRFLVGACESCGEIIRYHAGGSTGAHWLDVWPNCVQCGEGISRGDCVPKEILKVVEKWTDGFLRAQRDRTEIDDLAALSARLWDRCDLYPDIVRRLALVAAPLPRINHRGLLVACAIRGFTDKIHLEDGARGSALFGFLVGQSMPVAALVDVLASCMP